MPTGDDEALLEEIALLADVLVLVAWHPTPTSADVDEALGLGGRQEPA